MRSAWVLFGLTSRSKQNKKEAQKERFATAQIALFLFRFYPKLTHIYLKLKKQKKGIDILAFGAIMKSHFKKSIRR